MPHKTRLALDSVRRGAPAGLLAVLVTGAGCVLPAIAAAAESTGIQNLDRFKGKRMHDVMRDSRIASVVNGLLSSPALRECWSIHLRSMPELQLSPGGALVMEAHGSGFQGYLTDYISVAPDGRVDIVLQCERGGVPAVFQYLSTAGLSAPAPKPLVEWLASMIDNDSKLMRGDGRQVVAVGRESVLGGPARSTSAQAPVPSSSAPPFAVLGDWVCNSRKADGVTFQSAFRFAKDGTFLYSDAQSRMMGAYAASGPNANVQLSQVEAGGVAMPSKNKLAILVGASAPGSASFDMSLMTSRGIVTTTVGNNCASAQVAGVTRAPAPTLCQTNPAACAAIQNNQNVRQQVQDSRCSILRQQLAGMAAADYQLAKAGCL